MSDLFETYVRPIETYVRPMSQLMWAPRLGEPGLFFAPQLIGVCHTPRTSDLRTAGHGHEAGLDTPWNARRARRGRGVGSYRALSLCRPDKWHLQLLLNYTPCTLST